MTKVITFIATYLLATSSFALSPEATEGKIAFTTCNACHNPNLDKALAPPMWGVQRRYKKNTVDKIAFVARVASFANAPSLDTAIFKNAIRKHGLMPAIDLPKTTLENIATYIYEERFAAPCKHWSMAVKKASANGDNDHAKKDKRKMNRFCQ